MTTYTATTHMAARPRPPHHTPRNDTAALAGPPGCRSPGVPALAQKAVTVQDLSTCKAAATALGLAASLAGNTVVRRRGAACVCQVL